MTIGYVVPLAIIAFSLCGVLFILLRRARGFLEEEQHDLVYPETTAHNEAEQITVEKKSKFVSALSRFRDGGVHSVLMEKLFRKTRLRLMRVENWLTSIVNRLHERNIRKKEDKEVSSIDSQVFIKQEGGGNIAQLAALNARDEKFDETYWINLLKHEPHNSYPYKKLGEIYTGREDFKEARIVLKHALKLDPSDNEAKAMIEGLKGKRTKGKIQSA